uniref:Zinc finger, CCHC-type n=1 Tax=Tanacetum cinerariifolium TaxID=118510 RepID=A0A6L2NEH3_TANCI|nr:zinc finger, CCHC-type [Tanacetum cinerariifolium]
MPNELGVSLIFNSLNKDYDQFVQNYNMRSMGKTIAELHAMWKLLEIGISKKAETPAVLVIVQIWALSGFEGVEEFLWKTLVEKENIGFDLARPLLYFRKRPPAKGVGLRVADSLTATAYPSNVAENIIDSENTSSEDGLLLVHPSTSSFPEAGEKSKAAGKRKLSADGLGEGSYHGDRAAIVTKVVLDASIKLVHSDEMGVLVAKLVRATIILGRCATFEEVAKLKEPFIVEKIITYRTSLKEEYDQAEDDLANASYSFLSEFTSSPYAFVEQLLSKKL